MGLRDEILEQPEMARRVLKSAPAEIAPVARAIQSRDVRYAVIAARGTSDHAALYAQYVFGVRHRLPVALAAPSITSLYGVAPRFEDALVIGISQSGASPDVVGVLESARGEGALTVAITNEPDSPLAGAAAQVIELHAGIEHAVAATKTYTAELLVIALLSALLTDDADARAALDALPGALAGALETEPAASDAAHADPGMNRCVVLGRGFNYATAREWALKLKEIASAMADAYSSADFQHGPLTLVEPGFPVLAVAPSGPGAADILPLLERLRDEHGARLLVISDDEAMKALSRTPLTVPAGVPEWLSPIVTVVPAQLYAYHLAVAAGRDPEAPRHLRKITLTH